MVRWTLISITTLCFIALVSTVQFIMGFQEGKKATKKVPDPKEIATRLDSARTREDREKLRMIAQELDQLIQAYPNQVLYLYYGARAHEALLTLYLGQGEAKKAREELKFALDYVERALALDEASSNAHALRADLYGWKIHLSSGLSAGLAGMRYGPKISKDLDRALELDQNNSRVYLSLGRDYLFKPSFAGGNLEKAVKNFRRAVELDPTCVDGWICLGIALGKQKKWEEAKRALNEALRLSPENVWAKREKDKLNIKN